MIISKSNIKFSDKTFESETKSLIYIIKIKQK